MECLDCPINYIGKTGIAFHNRYKKHIKVIEIIIIIRDTQATY
jgi:hypothetical protein